eukprot:SAG31_NODE_3714_length_3957_cov_3.388025_3_plen_257_part_00
MEGLGQLKKGPTHEEILQAESKFTKEVNQMVANPSPKGPAKMVSKWLPHEADQDTRLTYPCDESWLKWAGADIPKLGMGILKSSASMQATVGEKTVNNRRYCIVGIIREANADNQITWSSKISPLLGIYDWSEPTSKKKIFRITEAVVSGAAVSMDVVPWKDQEPLEELMLWLPQDDAAEAESWSTIWNNIVESAALHNEAVEKLTNAREKTNKNIADGDKISPTQAKLIMIVASVVASVLVLGLVLAVYAFVSRP